MSQFPVAQVPLLLMQGASYRKVFRYGMEPYVYKAITGVAKAAPATVTAVGHGVPAGWPIWIESVKGMEDINRPRTQDPYTKTRIVDVDTIELNDINALDFDAYQASGVVIYLTPVDLAGAEATLQVRQTVASATPLITLSSTSSGITLDDATKTITIEFTAAQVSGLTIEEGVYDLELTLADGTSARLAEGPVYVSREVTRP